MVDLYLFLDLLNGRPQLAVPNVEVKNTQRWVLFSNRACLELYSMPSEYEQFSNPKKS